MNKPKVTLAVTGLNNTDNPGPGVPVIRSIRESEAFDLTVIGLAYETFGTWYLHAQYCRQGLSGAIPLRGLRRLDKTS